jgi:hypothetical protein
VSNPLPVVVTDGTGKALSISGSTTGSHIAQPLPVVLSDANGNALVLAGSVGGTWGSITGTLSAQTDLQAALDLKATLASPTFTGTPAAPTAAALTNTTQLATTAFVTAAVAAAPGGLWSAINARRHAIATAGGDAVGTTGGIPNGAGTGDVLDVTNLNTQFVAGGATTGPASKYGSASTASAAGIHGHNNIWRTGKNIAGRCICYLTRITDIRFWYGFTDQSLVTQTGSDNPAGNYAAFRFSATGGDTNIQCITKDNVTQTVVDSGVPPVAGTSLNLAIVADDTNGNYKFYINGVLKATIATHLPTSGTNLAVICSSQWVTTQTFHNVTAIDSEADF